VSIYLQYVDCLDDGKGESNEKKKYKSGEEAEARECGMASVAMSKIQIVVIILVKVFTAAPSEYHSERRSSWGGEVKAPKRPTRFVCCT
jgi:hypothetical protein